MSWTEERVALLKELWGEGKTAAEIANYLGQGVTRNAVIGKAHRLKLSGRVSPVQQKASANTNTKTAAPDQSDSAAEGAEHSRSTTTAPAQNKDATQEAETPKNRKNGRNIPGAVKGVKMQALRERMCRWPIGDPQEDDFHFCGGRTASGATYCKMHAEIAYQSSGRKSMKLDDVKDSEQAAQTAGQQDDTTPTTEEPAVSDAGA